MCTRLHSPLLLLVALAATNTFSVIAQDTNQVTRATLDNGLRVVIVRDPLAPVATLETNYLAGEMRPRMAFRAWRMHRNTWHFAAAPD
jgi:zinc protease